MAIELPTVEAKMEIGRIDPATGEIEPSDNHIRFSCQFSTDCCGSDEFLIPVTEMDIERIERRGYGIDQIVENLSPEIRFAKDDTAEKNYWIKRKPFTGKCTFLEGKKCSIHQFKPFACRVFPFQLIGQGDGSYNVVIHQSNLCQSVLRVQKEESENHEILQQLLDEVQREDKRRLSYFEKYGDS